jgi:adenosylcobinamide kinase/adenosylcobinamide-phosphate guanylyltransferase
MRSLFVIGAARSGKSRYAQARVEEMPGTLAFIATAEAHDTEMADRIARHKADRGSRWISYEAPLDLHSSICRAQEEADAILVDCVTMWLSNLMHAERDIEAAVSKLESSIGSCRVPIALVSNEVGGGIVPANALARRFRDHAGLINQRLSAAANEVVLVAAGLPIQLK